MSGTQPCPSAELSAREVLELVLGALASAEAGTAALHAFATDSLRGKAGTLDDLRRTFANELFGPLAGGHPRVVREFDERGDVARALVAVPGADYLFSLSRRDHGRHPGCWLVTAVARDLPGA